MLRRRKSQSLKRRSAERNTPSNRRRKLQCESLEARTMLTKFTVLNLADSGAGSLRQAVEDANAKSGADTITFAKGLTGTISLTSGQLAITDDLKISGPGASALTISGNNSSRVFFVNGGETNATISHVTIADGQGELLDPAGPFVVGGGILNHGADLRVSNVLVTNNSAIGVVAVGGGITNLFGGRLTVMNSEFTNNRVSGFFFAAGGAILNDAGSSAKISHSEFTGNVSAALFGGDESEIFQGVGVAGSFANAGGSDATILHSTFEGNLARGGDGNANQIGSLGGGGAILSSNNSLIAPPGQTTLTVIHSDFIGNQAIGGNGGNGTPGLDGKGAGAGNGGAINNDFGAKARIVRSTFVENQAIGGNGGAGGVGADGAAGNVFGDNTANGGAIFNVGATLDVVRSDFTRNEAIGGNGGNGGAGGDGATGADGIGGAISNAQSVFDGTLPSIVNVVRGTFTGNRAVGGHGGTGFVSAAGGSGQGGGIHSSFGEINLVRSTIDSNTVIGGGGANGGDAEGGGIWNGSESVLALGKSRIHDNQAVGGTGTSSNGVGTGGGLFNTGTLDAKKKDLDEIFANLADDCNDVFDNGLCI